MAEEHPDMRRGVPGEGTVKVSYDETLQCRIIDLRWGVSDDKTGAAMADFKERIILEDIDIKRRVQGTLDPIPGLDHQLQVSRQRWQALNQTSGKFIRDISTDIMKILYSD